MPDGVVDPIGIALRVSRALDAQRIVHTVGGSLASSFAGEPRSTIDIDIVAAIDETSVTGLVHELGDEFYVDETAIRRAIRERSTVNLIHHATQLKVDLFIAGNTPLDAQQLNRRQMVEVRRGDWLPVHPPEDILLQKLRWYRRSGETSDRQWRDVLGIVRVQGDRLDRSYLEDHAPALGVADLLAKCLHAGKD